MVTLTKPALFDCWPWLYQSESEVNAPGSVSFSQYTQIKQKSESGAQVPDWVGKEIVNYFQLHKRKAQYTNKIVALNCLQTLDHEYFSTAN